MTLENLMNPEGRGSSAMHMKIIHENLQVRYDKNIQKTIKVRIFQEGDVFTYYVRIPSESNEKHDKDIYYDVILQFYPNDGEDLTKSSLRSYGISAFSNSPSFTFTFTRVYRVDGLLPGFIPSKFYNKVAFHKPPVVRNPLELVGIEKSVWFAGYHLITHGLLNKAKLPDLIEKGKVKDLLKEIMNQDDKLVEVERRNEKAARERKAEKKREAIEKIAEKQEIKRLALKSDFLKRNSSDRLKVATTPKLQRTPRDRLKRGKPDE